MRRPSASNAPAAKTVLSDERGLTLVELLIAMTLSIVLLLAVLASADALMRGTTNVDRKADAQQEARRALGVVVEQLRDARPVSGAKTPLSTASLATRSSLVFSTRLSRDDDPATATPQWVRVCATASTGRAQVLVGKLPSTSFTSPGACAVSNTGGGWTYGPLLSREITNPGQLFNFSSGACVGASCAPANAAQASAITTVGIALTIDTGRDALPFITSDAVALRNRTP